MISIQKINKFICIIVFFCLFFCTGCITNQITPSTNKLYVNSDGSRAFSSIQQAINAAKQHSIIQVEEGIYHEHIFINKTIHLVGADPKSTIIDGKNTHTVISVNANNTTINGFTIKNSGTHSTYYEMDAGININANNTNISNCICKSNTVGIQINKGNLNKIEKLVLSNNSYGVFVYYSDYNIFLNNTIESNLDYGSYIYSYSEHNLFKNNYFLSNRYSFRIKGNQNDVVRNLFQNNKKGMYFCCGANGNIVYHNSFVNNTEYNGKGNFNNNKWYNDTVGGNYWQSYSGVDEDGDGFGDTPFIVEVRNYQKNEMIKDRLPLMSPRIDPIT